MKILVLADAGVGTRIASWLINNHRSDIGLVVTTDGNEISTSAKAANVPTCVFQSSDALYEHVRSHGLSFDLGVLAWWPKLLKGPLLDLPSGGFVNTHPSLLPHGRGKHYNFWTLVEQAPFGVSLHFVDPGIDTGDVISQREIHYSWEDTGETLYYKAQVAMEQLFIESYPLLRAGEIPRKKQDLTLGSTHRASELEPASTIVLDNFYTARDLLNRLRARTFPGFPACSFRSENGEQFEVRVTIRRKLE